MNELTKKDYVNILIEGAAMFFLMVAFLFILSEKENYLYFENYSKKGLLSVVVLFQAIVTWTLLYIRKVRNQFPAILAYIFIIGTIFYVIADENYRYTDMEESSLCLIFIVMEIAWIAVRYVHNQYYHKSL